MLPTWMLKKERRRWVLDKSLQKADLFNVFYGLGTQFS